jgi:outer membrane protein assembly factor BamB
MSARVDGLGMALVVGGAFLAISAALQANPGTRVASPGGTPPAVTAADPAEGQAAVGGHADWAMLAANPQRTSWVPDEVRGDVRPVWYRPIEPYINYKIQMIVADGKVFASTARGLYCLHADTGAILWIHATEIPLGHSPTYANGKVYVGSYDRTIHCLDANTGVRAAGWNPYVALAGFETNPLVVNGRVYTGNRDGYFYCLDANTGALAWRFKTGAAIRNSPAMDTSGVFFFASEDLHAYALRDIGASAQLVWKSAKLLGDTFASYWPVVYRDWVVFSGGMGYFNTAPYGDGVQLTWDEKDDINANLTLSTGTEPGDWAPGTVTMDASPILQYYESKPYRRRVFMLNRATGQEYTFDTDGDGKPEYAPFTFSGITQSGSKYPPVIGSDGVIYTDIDTVATSNYWTPSGALAGWKVGTRFISRVMEWNKTEQAADEPMAFSLGGNVAYWNLCCDREAGAFDLRMPFGQAGRWWLYWAYDGRLSKFPNYEPMYHNDDMNGWGVYGDTRGVYGKHGVQNPWIPYNGKLYRQMGNAVVAVAPAGTATGPLPLAATVTVSDTVPAPTVAELRQRLDEEIQRMVSAGHLKPGLFKSNIGDFSLSGNGGDGRSDMDQGIYYFSNPGDTIYTLVRALPLLSSAVQTQARTYIQAEMSAYRIDTYAYVGHLDGVSRQAAAIPPEYQASFAIPKQTNVYNNHPWYFPMTSFYAAWKYAQVWPAEASTLYNNLRPRITVPCKLTDAQLLSSTQILNAYIAGYRGYLELEKMAGRTESANVRSEYNRLLALRVNNFSIDAPWIGGVMGGEDYNKNFIYARHFLYLVPELAQELRNAKLGAVQAAVDRINSVTPYWFVGGYDTTNSEGTHQQLYDVATFNAYAMVLKAPYPGILKYLDAPVFPVGDLFYIQNLVSVLEAAGGSSSTPPSAPTGVRVIR